MNFVFAWCLFTNTLHLLTKDDRGDLEKQQKLDMMPTSTPVETVTELARAGLRRCHKLMVTKEGQGPGLSPAFLPDEKF